MCRDNNEFVKIANLGLGKVNLASNASTQIEGKGTVSFITGANNRPRNVTLHETLYVPELRTNLLSIEKTTDKDYKVVFDKKTASIINQNEQVVLTGERINGLYYISTDELETSAISQSENGSYPKNLPIETWHRRMGHLNLKDLIECSRNGTVQRMDVGKYSADLK